MRRILVAVRAKHRALSDGGDQGAQLAALDGEHRGTLWHAASSSKGASVATAGSLAPYVIRRPWIAWPGRARNIDSPRESLVREAVSALDPALHASLRLETGAAP